MQELYLVTILSILSLLLGYYMGSILSYKKGYKEGYEDSESLNSYDDTY